MCVAPKIGTVHGQIDQDGLKTVYVQPVAGGTIRFAAAADECIHPYVAE